MVLAETLNLHVSFDSFLFFFLLLFFFFSLSILSSARAQSAWRTVYSKEDNFIINHWVQNHCTLIVTYCITSNAEHVATLRASVEYYQLESTKSILMSPERLTVLWNLSSLLWFSFQSISQTCRMYKNRFWFTIDSTSLERCPGPRSDYRYYLPIPTFSVSRYQARTVQTFHLRIDLGTMLGFRRSPIVQVSTVS